MHTYFSFVDFHVQTDKSNAYFVTSMEFQLELFRLLFLCLAEIFAYSY